MSYKAICLNLWIGGTLFESIVDFFKKENADILLLQEVFDGKDLDLDQQSRSLSVLKKRLKYPHHHFAPAFLEEVENKKIKQGNAILSKFPLEEVSVTFYDEPFGVRDNRREAFHKTPRNLQHVITKLNKTELHLLNTQGIWGKDGRDSERRLQMSETIVSEFKGFSPILLAGDFNLQPDTQTIANIENHLINVFKNELKTSFNLKRKNLEKFPGFATAVVDMIFISNDILITNHYCPQVDVSDHLPLVVEFEIM